MTLHSGGRPSSPRGPINESPRRLAQRKADTLPAQRKADALLSMEEVNWVLSGRGNKTLLIRKRAAASGAPGFRTRTGTVVTLAQMHYYGVDLRAAFDVYSSYIDLLQIFIHHRIRPPGHKRRRAERSGDC